jgi:hypothetical protein
MLLRLGIIGRCIKFTYVFFRFIVYDFLFRAFTSTANVE